MANPTPPPKSDSPPAMAPWQKGLLIVVLLPFAGLFLPTLTVLGIGMLPTFGALIAERQREKHLAVTVGLMNLCGCLPAVVDLWSHGQSFAAVGDVMQDVYHWLIAFTAAGCGWLIYLMMQPLSAAYYKVIADARVRLLKHVQRGLVESWGEEIADEPGKAEGPARQ